MFFARITCYTAWFHQHLHDEISKKLQKSASRISAATVLQDRQPERQTSRHYGKALWFYWTLPYNFQLIIFLPECLHSPGSSCSGLILEVLTSWPLVSCQNDSKCLGRLLRHLITISSLVGEARQGGRSKMCSNCNPEKSMLKERILGERCRLMSHNKYLGNQIRKMNMMGMMCGQKKERITRFSGVSCWRELGKCIALCEVKWVNQEDCAMLVSVLVFVIRLLEAVLRCTHQPEPRQTPRLTDRQTDI